MKNQNQKAFILTQREISTVAEFCDEIGISRSTWHKLKRQGKGLAIVNIGGIQRIRREAIEAWLSENEAQTTADAAHKAAEGTESLHV